MRNNTKRSHENRTIYVNFESRGNYQSLIKNAIVFIEFIILFITSIGFNLKHKAHCPGGFSLTRHSWYERKRCNGLVIWRIQCKKCRAVFTVLPHFVLRYSFLSPQAAEKAILAVHGGLSLENCSRLFDMSPMAIYRLILIFGRRCLVDILLMSGLTLPEYFLADEKHSHVRDMKVYLPTIVEGRVIWHLGYCEDKSADSFEKSYGDFKDASNRLNPDYQVSGILTDGFRSTISSMKKLFPNARIGNCIIHATKKVSTKLKSVSKNLRKQLSYAFFEIFSSVSKRTSLKLICFGQRLRRFSERVSKLAGKKNGKAISEWIVEKKAGWYNLLIDPKIPKTSTLLDQAHNYLDRKLFMMKGFHHPNGNQRVFLNALALFYNVIPYQRRAKNSGKCGIEVQGGIMPSQNWFLNLQILSSGGYT